MVRMVNNIELFPNDINFLNPFFSTHLITCLGNKRSLLPFINTGVETVKKALRKNKLTIFDGFSGSGVVSRFFKYHSESLWVNDLEDYCEILSKCYLSNKSEVNTSYIEEKIDWLNTNKLNSRRKKIGFIEKNYAPRNDNKIQPMERVFYTNRNARIIDNLKYLINSKIDEAKRHFFFAPLIVKAAINVNTSGVFKGFHKKNKIGCFGGGGEDALSRIKREITLDSPIFSDVECAVHVYKEDVNRLVQSSKLPEEVDLAYYDPPYNQHPYGSNYFMLNIIANKQEEIEIQDGVSGISRNWNRSSYNKRTKALLAMDDLIRDTKAKYILISYNNEGMIGVEELKVILSKYGSYSVMEKGYNTYRGCRNLFKRNIKVKEMLWLLKKR